jgi:hypothetical protein
VNTSVQLSTKCILSITKHMGDISYSFLGIKCTFKLPLSQTMNAFKLPYQSSSGFSSSKSKCHNIFASSKRISAYARLLVVSLIMNLLLRNSRDIPFTQTPPWTNHERLHNFTLVIFELSRCVKEPSLGDELLRSSEVILIAICRVVPYATPSLRQTC